MKRKLLFILLVITSFHCYALDKEEIKDSIINSFWFEEKNGNKNSIKNIYELDNNFYITYIDFNNSQLIYFFDGKNENWEHPEKTISSNSIKYLKKIGNLDAYIGDFTYTETNQVLYIDLHPTMNWNRFVIKGPDFENIPFIIYFPSYQYPSNTMQNDIKKYNGKNTRINSLRYITFNDLNFCIVNGKRGFIINAIGNIFMETFRSCLFRAVA